MHMCPYGAMAIFILNKINLLAPKPQNRVRSALYSQACPDPLVSFPD
jgi:hypothetical protein